MIEWHPLAFKDQERITKILTAYQLPLSDYSFPNLWMWNGKRNYHLAEVDHFLCIKMFQDEQEVFLYPLGEGSRLNTIEKLYQEQRLRKLPFRMRAIPEKAVEELTTASFAHQIIEELGRADYIYNFDDLLHLPGNRYQAKRNLINQFNSKYNVTYQKITIDLLPQIKALEDRWFKEDPNHSADEHLASMRLLDHFFQLNVQGGALMVENECISYSVTEYAGSVMLLIHIEKALKNYKGDYQKMNQELLKHLQPTLYVNKEESLGLSHLEKSKRSYHPVMFLKKFYIKSV